MSINRPYRRTGRQFVDGKYGGLSEYILHPKVAQAPGHYVRAFNLLLKDLQEQYAQKLPLSFQEELLDFVQYLSMKAEQQEKQEWSALPLSFAMRDVENEPMLYNLSDLKVAFS
jgi:hypothetical protein